MSRFACWLVMLGVSVVLFAIDPPLAHDFRFPIYGGSALLMHWLVN
jgi:hypothetical protein